MYVRRELRPLSEDDLALYLDTFKVQPRTAPCLIPRGLSLRNPLLALHTIQVMTKVDTVSGENMYGAKTYRSIDHFVRYHLEGAASRESDRYHRDSIIAAMRFQLSLTAIIPLKHSSLVGTRLHDGMGVLTQHASLTAQLELAMQGVNPRVTIPYWDYTIDQAFYKDKFDGKVFQNHRPTFMVNFWKDRPAFLWSC